MQETSLGIYDYEHNCCFMVSITWTVYVWTKLLDCTADNRFCVSEVNKPLVSLMRFVPRCIGVETGLAARDMFQIGDPMCTFFDIG